MPQISQALLLEKNVHGLYDCKVPSFEEMQAHENSIILWKFRQLFAKPTNYIQQKIRNYYLRASHTPKQMSATSETHKNTIFGRAIIDALKGGASSHKSNYVTAEAFYSHISRSMELYIDIEEQMILKTHEEKIQELQNLGKKKKKKDAKELQSLLNNKPSLAQNPVFIIPYWNGKFDDDTTCSMNDNDHHFNESLSQGMEGMGNNNNDDDDDDDDNDINKFDSIDFEKYPICFTCGPPAAPERPYIVSVGLTDVTIEWYNPLFDGVQPWKYRILMRTGTRNFSNWRIVKNADKLKFTKYTVRELAIGIPCEFIVQSYNNGGWSNESEKSFKTIPGEFITPPTSEIKWRRINDGGILSIIDALNDHLYDRTTFLKGLSLLISFGQKQQGYKREFQNKIAELCMHAIKIFENDIEIISKAFIVCGYSLIQKKKKTNVRAMLLKENFIIDKTEYYMNTYRNNSIIINAISWLRSKLPKQIKLNPIITYKNEKAKELFEKEEIDEEQREADEALILTLGKLNF